jgi:hypothetical protein
MGSFENFETYHPIIPDSMLARLQKYKKKSKLIGIYMGSFENFETYHPIAIPDPRFHASETTKQKGKLEQNLRNFRNIPIIPILDW